MNTDKSKQKRTKSNQSLEKALQIIEVMSKNRGPMRLQDIAISLGLPASTVLRFLNTLLKFNYVNQNKDTLKYSLSIKFCQLGSLVSSQISIREVIRPYLISLSNACSESACLAIESNMETLYIDVVDGPDNMLKAMQRIGHKAPLHCTGVGKLLLLNYSDKKLDELIEIKGLKKFTQNTILTKDDLVLELNHISEVGYSMDNEECEIGAKCIACPIYDYTNKIVASISVTGPSTRMTDVNLDFIKKEIVTTAKTISEKLGYL